MLPDPLPLVAAEAARDGLYAVRAPADGPALDIVVILDRPGPAPAALDRPDPDGPGIVGVLRLVWTTRRVKPADLYRRTARGRPAELTERLRAWEVWGPRDPHPCAILTRARETDVVQAYRTLMRHPGPREAAGA